MNHRRVLERVPPRRAGSLVLLDRDGCRLRRGGKGGRAAVHTEPRVTLTRPERHTIEHSVGQPAFINAFEQTSIYPKIPGYVKHWYVDIGDRITKDLLLAELFVPELDAEYAQRKAQVAREIVMIEVAKQTVEVNEKQLQMAAADAERARADVGKFESAVERWESEVKRLGKMVDERVVDRQVLDESQKQLKSNIAARDAAVAAVTSAEAAQAAQRASLEKAKVDVDAARANAKVAETVEQRYAALVSYTQLTAPYDGIVVVRNANTGDFVQPALGDKTVEQDSNDLSKKQGAPIYVLARTDLVRVFVDVPEIDAGNVTVGTPATIRIAALDDTEISAKVTRTSWALNVQTRTLRAEIDLPNADSRLLPGMYAYATVQMKRPNVLGACRSTLSSSRETRTIASCSPAERLFRRPFKPA